MQLEPAARNGFDVYWKGEEWDGVQSIDFRFNRTCHEVVERVVTAGPGCPDYNCETCYPVHLRDFSCEDITQYNDQANWTDIDIINHFRSIKCPVHLEDVQLGMIELIEEDIDNENTGSFSEKKNQKKISLSKMIDDIIDEMDHAFQNDLGETVEVLWIPVLGHPGYIQIVHKEG